MPAPAGGGCGVLADSASSMAGGGLLPAATSTVPPAAPAPFPARSGPAAAAAVAAASRQVGAGAGTHPGAPGGTAAGKRFRYAESRQSTSGK